MRSPTTLRTSIMTVDQTIGVEKILVMSAVANSSVSTIGTSSSDKIIARWPVKLYLLSCSLGQLCCG
jgi:hypothetical protein